jgi:hypothetical protein
VTIAATAAVLADCLPSEGTALGALVRTVNMFRIEQAIRPRLRKKMDRFSQIALMAADQLQPQFENVAKTRVGVFLGNDFGGWNYVYEQTKRMIETRDSTAIDPYVATAWFPAAAQGEITIAHGILGQSKTFSSGFLSGGLAVEYAARMVAENSIEVALAGGVEAPNAPVVLRALEMEKRISNEHPAAEASGFLALCSSEKSGIARMSISRPRRCPAAALDDVEMQFDKTTRIRYHPPSIHRGNPEWNRRLSTIASLLRDRLGSRVEKSVPSYHSMDVGSASFPLSIIDASKSASEGIGALVLSTNFEGLYLAGAVTPRQ